MRAERFALPHQPALEVVGIDPGRLEVEVHQRPVRHRRRGRIGILAVPVVVHQAVVRGLLPQQLAATRVIGQHLQRVFVVDANAVGMQIARLQVVAEMVGRLCVRDVLAFDRRREKHMVAPHDRGRVAAAGMRVFHATFVAGRHSSGSRTPWRNAGSTFAPPLRPLRHRRWREMTRTPKQRSDAAMTASTTRIADRIAGPIPDWRFTTTGLVSARARAVEAGRRLHEPRRAR